VGVGFEPEEGGNNSCLLGRLEFSDILLGLTREMDLEHRGLEFYPEDILFCLPGCLFGVGEN